MNRDCPAIDKMLRSGTIIQLSDFEICVRDGSVYLRNARHSFIPCNPGVLGLLNLFSVPRTLSDAASEPSLAHDWVRHTHSIVSLIDAGILTARDTDGSTPATGLEQMGFGGAREHISMLNDRRRTKPYLDAVRRAVSPGDVVVELGCGTGILSAAAAQSGARTVYAIERTAIAAAAELLFRSNNLDDRVQLIRKPSSSVRIPEPADVLISEIIGNEPLSERVLEYVLDARRRLLKTNARMVPRRLEVMAQCLQCPDGLRDRYQFTAANTKDWSREYALDFSALSDLRSNKPLAIDVQPRSLKGCMPLGDRVPVATFDFATFTSPQVDATLNLPIATSGRIDAVHISFSLDLDDQQAIQNGFDDIDETTSWACRLWLPDRPIPTRPGESLRVGYRHNPFGSQLEFL